MKTFILSIFLTLVCVMAVAQWQQGNDPLMIKNSPGIAIPEDEQHALYSVLPGICSETNLSPLAFNWDTIVTFDSLNNSLERITQTFDVYGNVITNLVEKQVDDFWVSDLRYLYTYDESSKLLISVMQSWNSIKEIWENKHRSSFTYDTKGNLLVIFNESWSYPHWEKYDRTTFTYMENGKLLLKVNEKWKNSRWLNNYKYSYTYDQHSDNIGCLYAKWRGDAWGNAWRYTYAYDFAGNNNLWLYEIFQDDTWIKKYLELMTYNSSGQILMFTDMKWVKDCWVYLDRGTYSYKLANGNLSSRLFEVWENDEWANSRNNTYYYNADNNLIIDYAHTWLKESWQNDWKKTYNYDGLGNSVTGKFEVWLNNSWTAGGSHSEELSIYADGSPVYSISEICRYEASFVSLTTDISESEQISSLILLYPNPAADNITIELSSLNTEETELISILGLKGQLLIQQPAEQLKSEIDISGLAPGIYFVRIESQDGIVTKKLIKE